MAAILSQPQYVKHSDCTLHTPCDSDQVQFYLQIIQEIKEVFTNTRLSSPKYLFSWHKNRWMLWYWYNNFWTNGPYAADDIGWMKEICFFINTLRLRQNGCHCADDTFKCIFLNENIRISIQISLRIVPNNPINNIPAPVQIMAGYRPSNKPLSEPMLVWNRQ